MAQKKRSKPIRIALTEEQIANIINEAAQSRSGLNVESLEDRIAPSRFGLPVFGGAEAGLEGDMPTDGGDVGGGEDVPYDPENPYAPDAGEGGTDGGVGGGDVPFDPNNPDAPFDPNNPGDFSGDAGGSVPFDPNNPSQPFDPASGDTPPWMQTPGGEDGIPSGEEPGWFEGGGEEPFEGSDDPLAGDDGTVHDAPGGEGGITTDWSQFPEGFPVDELPEDLRGVMEERLQEMQTNLVAHIESGGDMPPAEELAEHRNTILTNLLDEYNG
ncbi:MAG: hypothetical protein ACYTDX_05515 [Planctomycetota bacterium]|jgi:hypothetical protein